jgi:hypothetical protein
MFEALFNEDGGGHLSTSSYDLGTPDEAALWEGERIVDMGEVEFT